MPTQNGWAGENCQSRFGQPSPALIEHLWVVRRTTGGGHSHGNLAGRPAWSVWLACRHSAQRPACADHSGLQAALGFLPLGGGGDAGGFALVRVSWKAPASAFFTAG